MWRYVRQPLHPQRTVPALRRLPRSAAPARQIVRSQLPVIRREISVPRSPVPNWGGFQTDPYVDYGRFLTPQGGILLIYKDLDLRLRHWVWAVFAWSASTGGEGWHLFHHSPVHDIGINLVLLIVIGLVNAFIVAKPVELYRSVEIRPDCMIIEGADVFWLRYMENGWPTLQPDGKGNMRLCGIYGTRVSDDPPVRRARPHGRSLRHPSARRDGAAVGTQLSV
jgi:hypothetical protein